MTSLNRSRRRAELFAALLDATPAASAPGQRADGRADRELAGLLQLVTTLRDYPVASGLEELATPRPAHTTLLRERLMTEAADVLTPERAERHAVLTLPPTNRGARERRLAAAATVLVVLGGTAGMASAAERALPGQALYPVKRGIERVDVALSTSTAGKGRDVLNQASTRLDEVKGLAEGPAEDAVQIPGTMHEFARQATEGTELMIQAYHETADPSTLQTVQNFAVNEGNQVTALAQDTPEVHASLSYVASTLQTLQDRATETCDANCPALPVSSVLMSSSSDVPAPTMPAADGGDLGTGDLPTELGTVPPVTGDGTTAGTDGSAVDSLPGVTSDPSATSPLPPILGLPGLGDDLGDGSGGSGAATGGATTEPGSGSTDSGTDGSSTPSPDPASPTTPEPTPAPTTSAPVDTPTPSPTPSDTPTQEDTPTPSDSPTASASDAGDGSSSSSAGTSDSPSDTQSDASGDTQSADGGDAAADAAP